MTSTMVLTEDEALELLAFLVTAARTQVDEPPDYAPMGLMTAAERLSAFIRERASPETRKLGETYLSEVPHHLRRSDTDGYVASLDSICRAVAQRLVERAGLDRRPS